MTPLAQLDAAVNLYQALPGSVMRITLISDGWGVRRNLNQLGLHVGDRVTIVRKAPFGGPIIVESGGNLVAIGRRLAERVRVEVVS